MIKFFRKIRQNLLNKNKVGKYLLYAFGEIILVIIGILIALNLNQRSEQKKTEAKIDAIFEDVLLELETDINHSEREIYNYQVKDSLASLVLNTNLTYNDYANKNSTDLWRFAVTWNNYNTSNNAYNILMANVDAIPEKYSKSVSLLNTLNNQTRPHVEQYNKKVEYAIAKNYDEFEEKHSWYADPDYKKNKEAINYRLNDYRYKNMVNRYFGEAILTHRTIIVIYRQDAIKCYKEIASVLNKSLDSIDYIIDEKVLKGYVGTYIDSSNPEDKVELTFEEEFLRLKREGQSNLDVLINLNSETEFAIVVPRGIVKFSKYNSDEVNTMTIHIGHNPVTYTKINP